MGNHKAFLLLIIATLAVMIVSVFFPPIVTMGLSVLYFVGLAVYRPKWLIPVLIIYFILRPFLLEFNDGLKLAGDAGIVALFLKVIWNALRKRDYRSIVKLEWYEWAYLLFCVVGAVSAFVTGVSEVAIIFQLRKFLVMYVLFYAVKRLNWQQTDLTYILKLIVGLAMLLISHGFVEKLSQREWLLPEAWVKMFVSPTNADRIYGLVGNPNSLGMFLFIAMIAGLILLNSTRHKAWYIPLVLSFGTFLMTYSRGSWLGIIFAVLVYLILTRKMKFIKQFAIVAISGYVLVFLPIEYADQAVEKSGKISITPTEDQDQEGGSIGDRFSSSFDSTNLERSVNTGRIFFVKKGFQILSDHPVIGTGFGTFGDSAALVYSSPIYEDYGLKDIYYYMGKDFYSDNQYIQIIVQTGIVGTLLFAVFMLSMLWRIWTTRHTHPHISYVVLSVWIFIAVVGVVYNVWENQIFPMLYFMMLAWIETIRNGQSNYSTVQQESRDLTNV